MQIMTRKHGPVFAYGTKMVTRRMIQKPYLFLLYNLESEGAIRETRTAILLRHALNGGPPADLLINQGV